MTDKPYYGYIDNPCLDSLELSVRAGNVLRRMGGVNTLDDFMNLTENLILAQPKAGIRTWREIKQLQDYLRSLPDAAPAQPAASDMTLRDAAALRALQGMLAHSTRYRPRPGTPENWHDAIAQEAFQIADAFIVAREGKTDE